MWHSAEALILSSEILEWKWKGREDGKHNNDGVATASSQPVRGRCKNRNAGPLSRNQREWSTSKAITQMMTRLQPAAACSRRWSSPSGFRRASVVSCHDVSDRVGISFPKNSSVLSYNHVRIDDYNTTASSWFHSKFCEFLE